MDRNNNKNEYLNIQSNVYCKDQIWLESKTGVDPGPRSPNNEFIECRSESQSESWAKILDFSVKLVKLQAQFQQRVSSDMPQCYDFRIVFQSPFLFPPFILYTMAFLPFSSSTCGLRIQRPFSSSPSPSLESSILSWKAARSLFRYRLHINAASRLAGRHLMRR